MVNSKMKTKQYCLVCITFTSKIFWPGPLHLPFIIVCHARGTKSQIRLYSFVNMNCKIKNSWVKEKQVKLE